MFLSLHAPILRNDANQPAAIPNRTSVPVFRFGSKERAALELTLYFPLPMTN